MIKNALSKFRSFFTKGHERTLLAKKNIAISFLLKGFSIVIGLVMIPMTISYVSSEQYGVWLTLSSIINWLSFFDVGLGNGLKNKLAEINAKSKDRSGKVFVSSTYGILIAISTLGFATFFFANKYINWNQLLNVSSIPGTNLSKISLVVVGLFFLQFILQILNSVLSAYQASSKISMINVIGQFLSLISIYILKQITLTGSLESLVLILAGIPVLVQLIASVIYYRTTYRSVSPNLKLVNFNHAKSLLGTGGGFFVIQIGALVLFQTDNIVIIKLFGPQYVTLFNIVYKLFSVLIMLFTIIITPFWSAYTDAYARGDLPWIKNVFSRMMKILVGFIGLSALLVVSSPWLYDVWLKSSVKVPFSLSIAMGFYVIGYLWMMLYCYFLNGIGKIKLQLYMYLVCILINIPLAIILSNHIGIIGVTISNVFVLVIMGIVLGIQCDKILGGSAKGIWSD